MGILEKKKEKKKKIREEIDTECVFFSLLFLINPTRRHFTFQMVFHRTFKEITIDDIVIGYLKKHSDWFQLFAVVSFSKLHDQIIVILINIGFLVSYSSVQVFYFYNTSSVHHTCLQPFRCMRVVYLLLCILFFINKIFQRNKHKTTAQHRLTINHIMQSYTAPLRVIYCSVA